MFRSLRDSVEGLVDRVRDALSDLIGGSSVVNTDVPAPESSPQSPVESIDEPIDIDEDDDYYEDDDDDDEPDDPDWDAYYSRLQQANHPETFEAEYRVFEDTKLEAKFIRQVRYTDAQDAITFLEESGLINFSEILYIEDEDLYTIAVYDSPGAGE